MRVERKLTSSQCAGYVVAQVLAAMAAGVVSVLGGHPEIAGAVAGTAAVCPWGVPALTSLSVPRHPSERHAWRPVHSVH
jgi:glycerol uptake facilitator-like aquaporin